ncbi:MAG: TRAP transporter large permease [Burkholderiales bacterium]|nr:MAG: TRAP transporter large permease [Burkholderiales bacterium]
MLLLPVVLLVLDFPFFLVLLATAAAVLAFFGDVPATALHQVMFSSVDKFALLAVPFFIFAGELMARGGVSYRLVGWVTSMLGGLRGALPLTALGTTAVFSAISGSTASTVAAVGGLTYGRLREAHYSERFSSGLLVSSGAMGNLIPPSIGFILYGIAAEASIVKLFAAGIIPGIVLGAAFALTILWYLRREGEGEGRGERFSFGRFLRATREGAWSIGAPVVVLGGIYAGVFSPTEAAGVACVYALVVVVLVHREMSWIQVLESASRSMYLTAQVFVIVAAAGVFSWLLTINGVPQGLVQQVTTLELPPWAVLLAINLFLLAVGMLLDTASSILVLTPLLAPMASALGVDPVHFGVILVMNLSIGTFTPLFGINLFVGQAVFRIPLTVIYRGVMPFIVAALAALMVVTYIPELSLALPRWL